MKRTIILTIALTTLLSTPCYALPEYSAETKKLLQEAGMGQDYSVEEIMERQEAYRAGKANNSTPTNQNTVKTSNRRLKGGVDEYRIANGGGNESIKVTDTDNLHIYSNDYENPSGYSKYSNDEFSIGGKETPSNDGYGENGFDELHIDANYRNKVWKPDYKVYRITIDEFRLPSDM
jgi:hypothetical protein